MIPSKHGAASGQPGAGKQQRYLPHRPFHSELKKRVDAYLIERGISQQGAPGMRLKTAIILEWLAVSWTLVTFFATEPRQTSRSTAAFKSNAGASTCKTAGNSRLSDSASFLRRSPVSPRS